MVDGEFSHGACRAQAHVRVLLRPQECLECVDGSSHERLHTGYPSIERRSSSRGKVGLERFVFGQPAAQRALAHAGSPRRRTYRTFGQERHYRPLPYDIRLRPMSRLGAQTAASWGRLRPSCVGTIGGWLFGSFFSHLSIPRNER